MQGVNLIIAFQLKTDLLPPKSRLTPYLKSEQVDFLTGKLLWHKNAKEGMLDPSFWKYLNVL